MRLEQSEPSGEKPTEGGTAADAAARAGELISPSEYQIEGAPMRLERSEPSGADAPVYNNNPLYFERHAFSANGLTSANILLYN